MKKEITYHEWRKCLNKTVSHPLCLLCAGYICQHNNNKSTITAVRLRFDYDEVFPPHSPKTLCIWNAIAKDVAAIIGENPDGAYWLLSDKGRINLVVKSKPSGNRRADMVKYPPVNHHTKESK